MSDERAVSKVVLNGKTLIDITNSTVTNENLLDGEIATGANGRGVVGGIPINTSANLTTSGATVTVPAGYYAEQVSKTIASGSATTPSTEITANPSITVSNSGLITTSAAANQSITPTVVAGYVTAGTAGTVTVSGSNTKQLDVSSVVGGTTTISGTTATRAKATWNRGWIQAGELAAATFANSATSGKTYVDISNTTAAPILVSGNYLYINAGYTDNLKISLAKLVPDGASVDLAEDKMLSGYSAYNNNGQLITGNIPTVDLASPTIDDSDLPNSGTLSATITQPSGYSTGGTKTVSYEIPVQGAKTITPSESEQIAVTAGRYTLDPVKVAAISHTYVGSGITQKDAATYYPSTSDQYINSKTYLSGVQTIKAVTHTATAAKIASGQVIKIGDSVDDDRITSITGTYTDDATLNNNNQMLKNVTAYSNGTKYTGSIETKTVSNLTASGKTVTVPAGYYATQVTKDVATAEQATPSVSIDSTGKITATATQTEGYVEAGTKTGTQQLTTKATTTYNTSTSDKTISSGIYITGTQTIKAVTTSNINAENIKDGITIKVGDANSAGRIKNVTGTFTDSSTVSSGQIAAAAGQILNGYSAWVDGTEVKGSIANKTASNLTASGATVTVPAGYYATQVTKDVATGSATTPTTTITANPTITVDTTTGVVTANTNASESITPTVSAGYVSTGTAGTVTVNGSGTSQIDIYEGEINENSKTRIYIHLEEGRTSPVLGCCPNGTVVVDWGDGSATETLTGTSLTSPVWTNTHNYVSAGDYVITLEVTNGTVALRGSSSSNAYAYLLRYSSGADARNVGYQNAIQRVEIGKNISIGDHAFRTCTSLSSITIPDSVTSIGTYAFYECYSLANITIPDGITKIESYMFSYCRSLTNIAIPNGVTSIYNQAFQNCCSLSSIIIPDSVTSIGNTAFQNCNCLSNIIIPDGVTKIGGAMFYQCYSLANITIPDGVTSIGKQAFYNCYSLAKIRFEPTTPPTVADSNAWTGVSTDCVISVPTGTLSAYTSATNYPDPATYTYIEE